MDRQPLSAPARRQVAGLVLAAGLAGCDTLDIGPPVFDGPTYGAILDPGEGSPFDEPVGFVSNQRSGRITPLDLKHATLLSDQYGAPWLAPRGLATGDERQLGQLVAWSPADGAVSALVVDLSFGVLVEVPYLTATEGEPQVVEPVVGDPVFVDADSSGDSPSLSVHARTGWATTEDWTVEYDGSRWWVRGSRSGKQGATAVQGERFVTDNGELELTVEGSATLGDRFTFSVDTGIVEHDLGGIPLAIRRLPGTSLVLVALWDAVAEAGAVVAFDLDTMSERGRVDLGVGLQPWRIEPGPVVDGVAELFVADAYQPLVHVLELDIDSGSGAVVQELDAAAPVAAVAWLSATQPDSTSFDHLFVAPAGLNRVDVYDLDAGAWLDVNPLDDVDAAGIDLYTPVMGLASSPDLLQLQTLTPWGVRSESHVVAMSTFDGSLLLLDAASGCLVTDIEGASVTTASGEEDIEFVDIGASSSPGLLVDSATGRRISTSPCGGLVRSESWTVTYDGVSGDWQVEGSLSGVQQRRAVEDQRYVSDNGGFSLLILSGPEPATDGDEFQFSTEEGILRLDAIIDSGSSDTPFETPGEPTVFQYDAGPTGGGWDQVDRRSFVLLPLTGNDLVLRVRLESWNIEVVWE